MDHLYSKIPTTLPHLDLQPNYKFKPFLLTSSLSLGTSLKKEVGYRSVSNCNPPILSSPPFERNTGEWTERQSLSYHRLSVTQMEFSSCDRFLVSVSRDRSWAVFQKDDNGGFALKYHSGCLDKKSQHSRIIWSCGWMPGSSAFITGSRDKSVVIWRPVRDPDETVVSWERGNVFEEVEEVMAVAVKDICTERGEEDRRYLIAVGFVTGRLSLRVFDQAMNEVLESAAVEISHRKSIRRLKFRPGYRSNGCMTLASCGDDHLVLLHEIDVTAV